MTTIFEPSLREPSLELKLTVTGDGSRQPSPRKDAANYAQPLETGAMVSRLLKVAAHAETADPHDYEQGYTIEGDVVAELGRALRSGAPRLIFLGSVPEYEQRAREAGCQVVVLPAR